MGQVGIVFHLCCLVYLTSGIFLACSSPAPHYPTFSMHFSMPCCPIKDEHSDTFKGIVFKQLLESACFMSKETYSTTTKDLVLCQCAANAVAPSMTRTTYNLSKRKKRSTIGKNIQKNSAFG